MKIFLTIVMLFLLALIIIRPPLGKSELGNRNLIGDGRALSIVRPYYPIPRQFRSSGWPLLGGEFGYYRDPHVYYTRPKEAKIKSSNGVPETIQYQGFDVNPHFTDSDIKESVLGVRLNNENYELLSPTISYLEDLVFDSLTLIGIGENKIIFFVPTYTDKSHENIERRIFLASWPLRNQEIVEELKESEVSKWEEQLPKIRSLILENKGAFCGKKKATRQFYSDITGEECS